MYFVCPSFFFNSLRVCALVLCLVCWSVCMRRLLVRLLLHNVVTQSQRYRSLFVANQVIRTDPTNILIRNLTKRRQQTKRSRSDGKEADSSAQTSATPIDTASHANSTSSLSSRPLTRSNSSKPTNNHNHTVSACSSNSSSTANSRLKRFISYLLGVNFDCVFWTLCVCWRISV